MKDLLKTLENVEKELNELFEKETGIKEVTKLNGKELNKAIDKFVDNVNKKEEKDKYEENKKEIEELKNGTCFKVFESTKNGNSGVCIDVRGNSANIFEYVVKGLSEILLNNIHNGSMSESDAIEVVKEIKREVISNIKEEN